MQWIVMNMHAKRFIIAVLSAHIFALQAVYIHTLKDMVFNSLQQELNITQPEHVYETKKLKKLPKSIKDQMKYRIFYGNELIKAAVQRPPDWQSVKKYAKLTTHIDQTNQYRETAFFIAVRANQRDIVRLLAQKGAHVDHCQSSRRTALIKKALQETVNEEDKKTMKLLVQELHADMNLEDVWGATTLMSAMHTGNSDLISWMIDELGFDVNFQNKRGISALMRAIYYRNRTSLPMLQTLTERGAQVNAEDEQGRTALSIASHYNNEDEIIQYLKAQGAKDGMTNSIRRYCKYNWYELRHYYVKQMNPLAAIWILAEVKLLFCAYAFNCPV